MKNQGNVRNNCKTAPSPRASLLKIKISTAKIRNNNANTIPTTENLADNTEAKKYLEL